MGILRCVTTSSVFNCWSSGKLGSKSDATAEFDGPASDMLGDDIDDLFGASPAWILKCPDADVLAFRWPAYRPGVEAAEYIPGRGESPLCSSKSIALWPTISYLAVETIRVFSWQHFGLENFVVSCIAVVTLMTRAPFDNGENFARAVSLSPIAQAL